MSYPIELPPITGRQRVGRAGLAMLCIGHGIGYLIIPPGPGKLPYGLDLFSFGGRLVPLWGAVWFALGLLVLLAAVRRRAGWGPISFAAGFAMWWGCAYAAGFILAPFVPNSPDASRSYLSCMLYVGLSLVILGTVPAKVRQGRGMR